MTNYQREGSVSNAHVGRDFELLVQRLFADQGVDLEANHRVDCGLATVHLIPSDVELWELDPVTSTLAVHGGADCR